MGILKDVTIMMFLGSTCVPVMFWTSIHVFKALNDLAPIEIGDKKEKITSKDHQL
jgi:hypothetical protein